MYDSNLSDKIVHYMHLVANAYHGNILHHLLFIQVSMRS